MARLNVDALDIERLKRSRDEVHEQMKRCSSKARIFRHTIDLLEARLGTAA
jgi:hypothetical protein